MTSLRCVSLCLSSPPLLLPHQVGNAVPPPMAKAIGVMLKKCIREKEAAANAATNVDC